MKVKETTNFEQLWDVVKDLKMEIGGTGRKAVARDPKTKKVTDSVSLNEIVKQLKTISARPDMKGKPFDKNSFTLIVNDIGVKHDTSNKKLDKSFFKKMWVAVTRFKNCFENVKKDIVAVKTKDRQSGVKKLEKDLMALSEALNEEDAIIDNPGSKTELPYSRPFTKTSPNPAVKVSESPIKAQIAGHRGEIQKAKDRMKNEDVGPREAAILAKQVKESEVTIARLESRESVLESQTKPQATRELSKKVKSQIADRQSDIKTTIFKMSDDNLGPKEREILEKQLKRDQAAVLHLERRPRRPAAPSAEVASSVITGDEVKQPKAGKTSQKSFQSKVMQQEEGLRNYASALLSKLDLIKNVKLEAEIIKGELEHQSGLSPKNEALINALKDSLKCYREFSSVAWTLPKSIYPSVEKAKEELSKDPQTSVSYDSEAVGKLKGSIADFFVSLEKLSEKHDLSKLTAGIKNPMDLLEPFRDDLGQLHDSL